MHHFFVKPEQINWSVLSEPTVRIVGADVNHAKNVLRIRQGEMLLISDGSGRDYRCQVCRVEKEEVWAAIKAEEESRELSSHITLYQGLPKSDKLEQIIQKAVELGIWRIVPVITQNTVVKLDEKKGEGKQKRWQMIAESAAKQSKRSIIPEVSLAVTLEKALQEAPCYDLLLFADENQKGMEETAKVLEEIRENQKIALFVGPEGGFDLQEAAAAKAAGFCPVSLGRRILRTETAGLALLSAVMLQLELRERKKK